MGGTILPYLGNKEGSSLLGRTGVGGHFYPSYAHTTLVKVGTLSHTSPSTEWPNGLQGGLNCETLHEVSTVGGLITSSDARAIQRSDL